MDLLIEIISPVHIGSGEVSSPYCDYIYNNQIVYYIDHDKLERKIFSLKNSAIIIDEFVEIVKKQAEGNKSDRYKLANFFRNNGLKIDDYILSMLETSDVIRNQEINRIVYTGFRPIIPGSSLKGAIRTALLFNHLKTEGYNFNEMRRDYIGQDKFGSFANDLLKYLHVSDSLPLQKNDIWVYKTNRFNLKKKQKSIDIIREALAPGSKTTFKIQSKAPKENHLEQRFNYLFEGNEDIILEKINQFYIQALKKEIEELKRNTSLQLKGIISKYILLLNEAEKLLKTGEGAVLRIGAGKTYFENTIARIFTAKELFTVRKKKYQPFPRTRAVVIEDGKISNVLGWIKIKKINKSRLEQEINKNANNKGIKYANLKEFVEERYGKNEFKKMALLKLRGNNKLHQKYVQEFERYKKLHA